jgi:hypothetical protein
MWEPCSVQCCAAAGMKRVTPEELVLYLAAQHLQRILHRREIVNLDVNQFACVTDNHMSRGTRICTRKRYGGISVEKTNDFRRESVHMLSV